MKQILQSLKSGAIQLAEGPRPAVGAGRLLIQSSCSLISVGTERMLLEFGKSSYLGKARSQPAKVRQVLDKIRSDGLRPTLEAVRDKLERPLPLGYCNVGVVREIGPGGDGALEVGDRVVSNGPHAQWVSVPRNLCALVPNGVEDQAAVYTVAGAVALQGVRLARPTLGECFLVIGLGLIGQLTVQVLLANGCRVLGLDYDNARCRLAAGQGAETLELSPGQDPLEAARHFSDGHGVDGALITASTSQYQPVRTAAECCRRQGRIILVGVAGLQLRRPDLYAKELSLQVSCSYGPGRYDPEYEEKGRDYPYGLVRWTEQRNFEAVLALMRAGSLDTASLTSHVFDFERAPEAYQLISESKEPYLGVLLRYGSPFKNKETQDTVGTRVVRLGEPSTGAVNKDRIVAGVIGAGNFTSQVVLPSLKATKVVLKTIASTGGLSAAIYGKKFNFEQSATDLEQIWADEQINTVFITTRHNTHAHLVLRALREGKNVFVEKPLCLNHEELGQIQNELERLGRSSHQPLLMVGFNRRFAPFIQRIKTMLQMESQSMTLVMTINTGALPNDHWTKDPSEGGGRIIGEVCHFIDLLRYLAGNPITYVQAIRVGRTNSSSASDDSLVINIGFSDGSLGTMQYLANGSKAFPKERLEVFCGGKILQLNNFRVLKTFGWQHAAGRMARRQDKGHAQEFVAWVEAIEKGGSSPITWEELYETTLISLDLAEGLSSRSVFNKKY